MFANQKKWFAGREELLLYSFWVMKKTSGPTRFEIYALEGKSIQQWQYWFIENSPCYRIGSDFKIVTFYSKCNILQNRISRDPLSSQLIRITFQGSTPPKLALIFFFLNFFFFVKFSICGLMPQDDRKF